MNKIIKLDNYHWTCAQHIHTHICIRFATVTELFNYVLYGICGICYFPEVQLVGIAHVSQTQILSPLLKDSCTCTILYLTVLYCTVLY